jgi:hypothetical protein
VVANDRFTSRLCSPRNNWRCWGRIDQGHPAVGWIRPSADETGSLKALHGTSHRGRIGVEFGREIDLPLRSGIPEVHYGPGVVNELIREALYPYPDGLALVSKVAARRDESGAVLPYDEPHQLRAGIEDNLRTLGIEHLSAVNLRLMDNAVPDDRFVDQLGAMIQARDEGLIAGIGLSNISHAHLLRALEFTEIVCVQNFFNLVERKSLLILHECLARAIAFVPFCPLGGRVSNKSGFAPPQ